ncbi:MAG: AAA family ATPase [Candidatus Sericytochromatia bacterium]
MSFLRLEFPILVQVTKTFDEIKREFHKSYKVSPLFLNEIYSRANRFEKSIQNLKNKVRNEIKGLNLNRENINNLLWYLFNPEINFNTIDLDFMISKTYIAGRFSYVWFEIKGYIVVCLPNFDRFMFIASKKTNEKVNIQEKVSEVIKFKMAEDKKKYKEEWDYKKYFSTKSDFITVVDIDVFIKHEKFDFEQEIGDFFSFMFSNNEEMYGDEEIEKVGTDLNLLFPNQLNRALYRDEIVESVKDLIYQKENTAFVIVGSRGVGKTTIIHEAIHQYLEKNENKQFSALEKIWEIDSSRIIAGMSIIGMWQKRFESIIQYAMTRIFEHYNKNNSDKLFFRNMVALLRVGKSAQNNMTLSDVLKPFLEKRQLTVIGEATPEEWKTVQDLDRKFADLFQVIRIPEMSFENSVRVIIHERARLENENNCTITENSLNELFNLQRMYIKNYSLPGNIINFLKNLANKYEQYTIDKKEVLDSFNEINPVSIKMLDKEFKISNDEIETFIRKKLIGQEEAINCMIDTINLIKSNLSNPEKPYGVYLFIGPTGVGKTEAAKILAKYIFGSEESLVRFDMNEFIDYDSTRRLIGDLYNPDGQLTSRVRNKPFCVLLFDEIEKSHYSVHNLLLQILGEGRLTDAIGRTIDFTNTIIIMTSNLGAREAGKSFGFNDNKSDLNSVFRKAVENFFAPEFINRIDKIIPFKHLELENIISIARLQIQDLLQRDGFVRRNMILNISDKVINDIAKQGFDINYGARALKRSIEKNLISLTAEQIVNVPLGEPMIFEVYSSKKNIIPRVEVLKTIKTNKNFNISQNIEEKELSNFFNKLLEEIENINNYINEELDKKQINNKVSSDNWAIYNLKDQIIDLKDELSSLTEDIELKNISPTSVIGSVRNFTRGSFREYNNRKIFEDVFAQLDIREYLYEIFQKSKVFSDTKNIYLKYFLDTGFLKFFSNKLFSNLNEQVYIKIKSISLSNTFISLEVEYLQDLYTKILDLFNIGSSIIKNDNEIYIITKGIGIYDLLKYEEGLHLFFVPYQNYVPIEVNIGKIPNDISCETFIKNLVIKEKEAIDSFENGDLSKEQFLKNYGEIIRYYSIDYNYNRNNDIITDLKTNLITKGKLTENDIKTLIYGNINYYA